MTNRSTRHALIHSLLLTLTSTLALAGGCATGGENSGTDGGHAGHDAGLPIDAATTDAALPVDAATADAATTDAATTDAGADDAGTPLDAAMPHDAGAPDDAGGATVGAPSVDGEPRADHRRPSWVWTVPTGAAGFRVRIDGGAWTELPLATTVHTATADLGDGAHTFEVQARDAEGRYGPSGTFETEVTLIVRAGDTWWRQSRVMSTSPHGHVAAISAHNAYSDNLATSAQNLTATLSRVHAAQSAGADLIELDLVDGGGGRVLVAHDDTGATTRASLADVLDDAMLAAGNQVLFLEIKETSTGAAASEAFVGALLDILKARRAHYARAGRHVVLRAFHNLRAHLDTARTLLDTPEYVLLRPYVRLSVLFSRNTATAALIDDAAARGYHMIEPEYRSQSLMTRVAHARSLGLGVNIWTVPVAFGEVFVANARESVDAITVDYPIAQARAVVQDANALFFVDAAPITDVSASSISYRRTGTATYSLPVGSAGRPLLRIGTPTQALAGGYLTFVSTASRAATLYDADARPNEGVFLAAVVRFATTSITDGTTMTVLGKANTGAWTLELFNPSGAAATVLRFGVYVDGAYRYATAPATALTTTRAHFITGAYDGDGGVRMWIDNDDSAVSIVNVVGGVVNNDVPAMLGADPQDGGAARYYFDGDIQMALLQAWGSH